jgi:tetratricopeptide (TPR) repeat protein
VHKFGVREVEKLLRLPRRTIHGLVKAGFVSPERGARRTYLFSFQDLIVLRTAQALAAANIPAKRITRSLRELRRHLPDAMPLSGLSIGAVGDRVVVKEGASRWQAESGQYLLAFEGDPVAGSLKIIENADQEPRSDPDQEPGSDPNRENRGPTPNVTPIVGSLDAEIDRGYDLHEAGRLADAEAVYRSALRRWGEEPLLLYNLGVLLEDLGRNDEALECYEAALRRDPRMADCHYNLALLCERLSRPREAIRHMAQYRRLVAEK